MALMAGAAFAAGLLMGGVRVHSRAEFIARHLLQGEDRVGLIRWGTALRRHLKVSPDGHAFAKDFMTAVAHVAPSAHWPEGVEETRVSDQLARIWDRLTSKARMVRAGIVLEGREMRGVFDGPGISGAYRAVVYPLPERDEVVHFIQSATDQSDVTAIVKPAVSMDKGVYRPTSTRAARAAARDAANPALPVMRSRLRPRQ